MTTESPQPWYRQPWKIGLFVLVTLIVVMAALVAAYATRRLWTIASIRESGGLIGYESRPAWAPENLPVSWPEWLLPFDFVLIGANQGSALDRLAEFRETRQLNLSRTQVTDAQLRALADFPRLESLRMNATRISDAGLASLASCRNLHLLSLAETAVGDEGLKHLVDLPLESLDLSRTRVTDAGMDTISQMRRLQTLILDGTTVGDAGVEKFRGMALTILGLVDTKVTDAGLASMDVMREMQCLELDRTMVGDRGVAALAAWPRLDMLAVSHTHVTDAGLVQLAKLPLRTLDLSDTAVTDAGLKALFTRGTWTWIDLSDTRVTAQAAEGFARPLQLFVDQAIPGQLTITRASGARPTRWASRTPESRQAKRAAAEPPREETEASQAPPRP